MNVEDILQQAIDYSHQNTTMVIVIAVVLAILTIYKPKTMMKLYGACVLALIGLYLLSLLGGVLSSGIKQKDRMIYKTREAAGE